MKALSNGFVFDTEDVNVVLVAKHETEEFGSSYIYRTINNRYFSHDVPSKKGIEEGEVASLRHLENGVLDLDDLIEEWAAEFEEKAEVFLEKFPQG